jgi:hypothetical protein
MRRARLLLPVAALLCLASPVGLAWSTLGHRLVGEIAQRHLQPATARAVRLLLAGEPVPTLAGVADWADRLRDEDPARFARTARWHYVNFQPNTCAYDAAHDCAGGQCVVGAIQAEQAILADRGRALSDRRDALKFLVHLVADVHQPLHAGGRNDKGGNRYQVSLRTDLPPPYFARNQYDGGTMGTNLHAVWDYYLLATPKLRTNAYADRIDATRMPSFATTIDPARWAEESCRVAQAIYPQGHRLDHTYLDAERPVAERRIREAAYRLAHLLDVTLGGAR